MRRRRPAMIAFAVLATLLVAAPPAYAGGFGGPGGAPTAVNAFIAALAGLAAGGLTLYVRGRRRRDGGEHD